MFYNKKKEVIAAYNLLFPTHCYPFMSPHLLSPHYDVEYIIQSHIIQVYIIRNIFIAAIKNCKLHYTNTHVSTISFGSAVSTIVM